MKEDGEFDAIIQSIRDISEKIINLAPNIPTEANIAIRNIDSNSFLVHFVASNLNIGVAEKQQVLANTNPRDRAVKVLELLTKELQILELKDEIQNKVRNDIDKQ